MGWRDKLVPVGDSGPAAGVRQFPRDAADKPKEFSTPDLVDIGLSRGVDMGTTDEKMGLGAAIADSPFGRWLAQKTGTAGGLAEPDAPYQPTVRQATRGIDGVVDPRSEYEHARDERRDLEKRAEAEQPGVTLPLVGKVGPIQAAEMVGQGALLAAALPAAGAEAATTGAGRIGQAMAVGGAQGGANALGSSEAPTVGGKLKDAAVGGGTGAVMGGTLAGAGELGRLGIYAGDYLRGTAAGGRSLPRGESRAAYGRAVNEAGLPGALPRSVHGYENAARVGADATGAELGSARQAASEAGAGMRKSDVLARLSAIRDKFSALDTDSSARQVKAVEREIERIGRSKATHVDLDAVQASLERELADSAQSAAGTSARALSRESPPPRQGSPVGPDADMPTVMDQFGPPEPIRGPAGRPLPPNPVPGFIDYAAPSPLPRQGSPIGPDADMATIAPPIGPQPVPPGPNGSPLPLRGRMPEAPPSGAFPASQVRAAQAEGLPAALSSPADYGSQAAIRDAHEAVMAGNLEAVPEHLRGQEWSQASEDPTVPVSKLARRSTLLRGPSEGGYPPRGSGKTTNTDTTEAIKLAKREMAGAYSDLEDQAVADPEHRALKDKFGFLADVQGNTAAQGKPRTLPHSTASLLTDVAADYGADAAAKGAYGFGVPMREATRVHPAATAEITLQRRQSDEATQDPEHGRMLQAFPAGQERDVAYNKLIETDPEFRQRVMEYAKKHSDSQQQ